MKIESFGRPCSVCGPPVPMFPSSADLVTHTGHLEAAFPNPVGSIGESYADKSAAYGRRSWLSVE